MIRLFSLQIQKADVIQLVTQTMLVVLLAFGIISLDKYNVLPATSMLEATFFLLAITAFSLRQRQSSFIFATVSSFYVIASFIYAVPFNKVHPLDFLQAYKAFIYIPLMSFFLERKVYRLGAFVSFFKLMIVMFYIKYLFSKMFGLSERLVERPGILDENNFELMLLILPLFALAKFKVYGYMYYFLAVFFLVVISGSRSALLAIMICFVFTFFRKVDVRFYLCLLIFPVLVYLAYGVFEARMVAGGGIENVDRIKLFYYFLYETDGWTLFDYVVGAERLTRLSDATCLSLPFYDDLYSFAGDNSCYSVILHSYLMRVIFDHGVLGFIFVIAFYYRGLVNAGYDKLLSVGFILAVTASALSVSSFNSIYVALSLVIVVSLYKEQGCSN